mmetsp:Transcript_456/g.755  ORF Transcript_456/g.755 Transcript_456/m.755 type:complete len:432 (+) Transcript_456:27-1322(+)
MAAVMTLQTTDSIGSKILETLAVYCGSVPDKIKIASDHKNQIPLLLAPDPSLQKELKSRLASKVPPSETVSLNQPRTIARYISRITNNLSLLGNGPLEEALVDELLSIALSPLDGPAIAKLEALAQKSTYLGSQKGPRLGDVAVYVALHPLVAGKTAVPPGLTRFFDLMQHHHQLKGKVPFLPLVGIPLPDSPLFCPPAPTTKPAQASSGKSGKKGGDAKAAGAAAAAGSSEGNKGKKAGKSKADKAAKKAAKKAKLEAEAKARAAKAVGHVDMRVGRISSCAPAADPSLYISQVQVGEACGNTRQVVSRLGGLVPLEAMSGALVVLIVNLPEGEFGGAMSQGRILCGTDAADAKKKVLVTPPSGAKVGERVMFDGAEDIVADKIVKDKKLRPVMKKLVVSGGGVACFGELVFKTSSGNCTCPGIEKGTIA